MRSVITGTGPAGVAAALHLLRAEPALARRVIASERLRHPRPKVCADGLVPRTLAALKELSIDLDAPAVRVFAGIARLHGLPEFKDRAWKVPPTLPILNCAGCAATARSSGQGERIFIAGPFGHRSDRLCENDDGDAEAYFGQIHLGTIDAVTLKLQRAR